MSSNSTTITNSTTNIKQGTLNKGLLIAVQTGNNNLVEWCLSHGVPTNYDDCVSLAIESENFGIISALTNQVVVTQERSQQNKKRKASTSLEIDNSEDDQSSTNSVVSNIKNQSKKCKHIFQRSRGNWRSRYDVCNEDIYHDNSLGYCQNHYIQFKKKQRYDKIKNEDSQ